MGTFFRIQADQLRKDVVRTSAASTAIAATVGANELAVMVGDNVLYGRTSRLDSWMRRLAEVIKEHQVPDPASGFVQAHIVTATLEKTKVNAVYTNGAAPSLAEGDIWLGYGTTFLSAGQSGYMEAHLERLADSVMEFLKDGVV